MFAKALKEKKMSSWFNTDIPSQNRTQDLSGTTLTKTYEMVVEGSVS